MAAAADADVVDLLVYSDDKDRRAQVIAAVGARPGKGKPRVRWTEAATAAGAQDHIHNGNYPVVVLDAETTKVSGMVLAKTLAMEEDVVPKIVMLVARPQDQWLSTWAGSARTVQLPLNPIRLQEAISDLL